MDVTFEKKELARSQALAGGGLCGKRTHEYRVCRPLFGWVYRVDLN